MTGPQQNLTGAIVWRAQGNDKSTTHCSKASINAMVPKIKITDLVPRELGQEWVPLRVAFVFGKDSPYRDGWAAISTSVEMDGAISRC